MRWPWLHNRKRLFFNIFTEFIIVLLFFSLYLKNNFINEYSFYIFFYIWIIIGYVKGRYSKTNHKNFKITLFKEIKDILITLLILFIINKLIFTKELLPKENFIIYFYISLTSLVNQVFLKIFFSNYDYKDIIFYGSKNAFDEFRKLLNESKYIKDIYFFEKYKEISNQNTKLEIVLNDNDEEINLKKDLLGFKNRNNCSFLKISDWCETRLQRIQVQFLSDLDILTLRWGLERNTYQKRIKRISDILLSFIILILSSPIIIICALLIKLEDKGPIFYKQNRTGILGQEFEIIKLRTMRVDAEKDGPKWAKKGDSRITKIGSILRKLRLDELPQLYLVFIGKMSLIGPRPERPEINSSLEKEISHYNLRHTVRPGLSGWAQVNYNYGASIEDSKIKLSYELFYIRNFSFWLDFLIFFKTIKLILNGKGSDPNQ